MTCNITEPADLTDKRQQCHPPMTTTLMTSVGMTQLLMYVRCMSHLLFLESVEFSFTFCEFTHSEFIHLVSRNFSMPRAVCRHDFCCKVNCFTGISCSCDSCSHPDTKSVRTVLGGVHHDTHSPSIHICFDSVAPAVLDEEPRMCHSFPILHHTCHFVCC